MQKNSLITLLDDISSCTLCEKNLPLGANPVVRAESSAKVLIIGQAPGTKVHTSGTPWDDPSGKRLRQWLSLSDEAFYNTKNIAIMPMGFCYPGKGKSGDLPPRPECAPQWHPQLLEHLPSIQITLLIGQYAQAYYLPKDKRTLTQRVNFWLEKFEPETGPAKLIPLPHPSPRNTLWLRKNPWFEEKSVPLIQNVISKVLKA